MAETELKPCPFCGDHDVQLQYVGNLSNQVICLACGARGPADGYDEALERWTRRTAPHNDLQDELEAKDKRIATVTEEREFWRERVEGAEREREEACRRFKLERSYSEDADKHIAALEVKLTRRKVGYQKNVAHKQAMNAQLEKELQEMTASNRRHVAALKLAQLRIAELEAERDAVPGKASMWLIGEREIPTKVFSVANEAALRGETVVTLYKRLQAGFKRAGD
ncbi:Lar family restriction alleviation protein [Serratia plymuthica]|uniref:Lar family restriction alleviation protein n=1 Tax=Serratia plymuthica TaxID=82996 RepID=UPI000936469B|nr:Lar family restriction alleviation protein [Serratia plymuthica]OJT40963.1 hypothetical protein BSR04_12505 [Serratia plymuthica]